MIDEKGTRNMSDTWKIAIDHSKVESATLNGDIIGKSKKKK